MDILGLIKDKLTDNVIEKVSDFLGENPEKIAPALNGAVPIVLGSIIHKTSNEEDAGKLMDVLKDGGHTGEILEDLSNLLGNHDKTQLLITIGSNIFNHFSGNIGNGIVEKLSTLNGVRKTSASSLVGLAAPLVLGALGKIVEKEGLGVSGLTKLLTEQRESVFGTLPPAIVNQFSLKNGSTLKTNTITETKADSGKTSVVGRSRLLNWIPWVLIGLLFLAGLAYFWKYRKQNKEQEVVANTVNVLPKQDSLTVNNDPFKNDLPIDSINNAATIKADDGIKIEEKSSKIVEQEAKIEAKDSKITDQASKKEEIIKPVEKEAKTPKSRAIPEASENNLSNISISESLKNNKSWIALNTDFKRNSAEISSKKDLDEVASFLKNNRKTKAIIAGGSQSSGSTLAEDRAYAVRENLLERGVFDNQLSVQSSPVKDINARVVIKIK